MYLYAFVRKLKRKQIQEIYDDISIKSKVWLIVCTYTMTLHILIGIDYNWWSISLLMLQEDTEDLKTTLFFSINTEYLSVMLISYKYKSF